MNVIFYKFHNFFKLKLRRLKVKMPHQKNIAQNIVFTTQEFLTLADVTILKGATDSELKSSLSMAAGPGNSHLSDDEAEPTDQCPKASAILKEELIDMSVNDRDV